MPQMAPMNWLILFIMFTLIFMMFNCLNYYSFMYKNKSMNNKLYKKLVMNWKW